MEVLGYVTVHNQEPRTRLTISLSSNMWLSQRRRVEMLVVVVRAHKNGNMMEDVTCQSWTYSPSGRWGPYSAPLGRVDHHSRCMHIGHFVRTLLLADREPWVDKRVTKVAALLFRMSHHCKATPWPVCFGG